MSGSLPSYPQNGPSERTSFHGIPGSGTSLFIEKTKPGLRGSTPDSEALASSDDEQDHAHRLHSVSNIVGPRPGRPASWLIENSNTIQRKSSLTGGSNPSLVMPISGPASADQSVWAATAGAKSATTSGRGHTSNSSFPWANAIWNNDAQKGPPSRLTEVLPSPKSMDPMASGVSVSEEPLLSPLSRESTADSSIPFAIPLQPTLKSYRSQSYSVGQLDPEVIDQPPAHPQNQPFSARMRSGASMGGLSHRHSRPSVLGDRGHDSSGLGQLREVDDDEESSTGSGAGALLASDQAKTIERLAIENAMLRQAAAQQLEASRARARAVTETSITPDKRVLRQNSHNQHGLRYDHPSLGYTDSELEPNHGYGSDDVFSPRGPETRNLESLKKGHWQSSLGFGGLPEIPQSRRHSFAEVPTRQPSVSSSGNSPRGFGPSNESLRSAARQASPSSHGDRMVRPSRGETGEQARFHTSHDLQDQALELEHLRDRNHAVSYFSNQNPTTRAGQTHQSSLPPTTIPAVYPLTSPYNQTQSAIQHQPRAGQSLYVVTFKACRAEVFYASEGTGLQIKPGDLVIVEADRGTDLGTVAHENVTWSKAADLKKHFADEHYRWLMLFSRHGQSGTATAGSNPLIPGGARMGIGLQGMGQPGAQDPSTSEIKPKMIKRIAQPHEIQTLKDKEANEAKAKRVCQQKAAEQRLNMEILDAEFQMDWKKLTFYYFADSYINFNPLVTDLFKIYKTRIWMSAISQLSLPAPSAGLQLPVGQGPGAFTADFEPYPGQQPRGAMQYSSYNDPNLIQLRNERMAEPTQKSAHGTLNGTNVYDQTFRPHNISSRSIDQLSFSYNQVGQPTLTVGSRFGPGPYTSIPASQAFYSSSADRNHGQSQDPTD